MKLRVCKLYRGVNYVIKYGKFDIMLDG